MKKQNVNSTVARIKKTVITVIICAIPFVLLTVLTGTCLSKLHFFSWMLEHYYMFVWVAALILAWFSPYRAVYLSYAFPVTVILGQFLGDCIDEYRKSQMIHEELLRFTTRNFPVWVYSFLIAIALFELVLAVRSCYRRVQGEEGAAKRVLTYAAVCLVPFDMYPESWTHIYELGGTHGCYPVFYRWHPFCFCLNSFIVVVIYIFLNRL